MLITLIINILILGLFYYLVNLLPIPQPFKQVINVIFIIILIIVVLNAVGFLGTSQSYYRI